MRRFKRMAGLAIVMAVGGGLSGGVSAEEVDQGSVARGGKLYDKW